MARNGKDTATATAVEPKELYDSLSQDGQDNWDEIGSLGYTPEKGFGGMWFARKNGDPAKEAIGPSESISVLVTLVKEAAGSDTPEASGEVEIMEDHKGPRLPGIPLVADQEILTAAGKFKSLNTEWSDKGKQRKEAQDELRAICHSKPHLFKKDPNNSNAKIYQAGGMIVRLKDEHKEKVEVELEEIDA